MRLNPLKKKMTKSLIDYIHEVENERSARASSQRASTFHINPDYISAIEQERKVTRTPIHVTYDYIAAIESTRRAANKEKWDNRLAIAGKVGSGIGYAANGIYNHGVIPTVTLAGKGIVAGYEHIALPTANLLGKAVVGAYNHIVIPTLNLAGSAIKGSLDMYDNHADRKVARAQLNPNTQTSLNKVPNEEQYVTQAENLNELIDQLRENNISYSNSKARISSQETQDKFGYKNKRALLKELRQHIPEWKRKSISESISDYAKSASNYIPFTQRQKSADWESAKVLDDIIDEELWKGTPNDKLKEVITSAGYTYTNKDNKSVRLAPEYREFVASEAEKHLPELRKDKDKTAYYQVLEKVSKRKASLNPFVLQEGILDPLTKEADLDDGYNERTIQNATILNDIINQEIYRGTPNEQVREIVASEDYVFTSSENGESFGLHPDFREDYASEAEAHVRTIRENEALYAKMRKDDATTLFDELFRGSPRETESISEVEELLERGEYNFEGIKDYESTPLSNPNESIDQESILREISNVSNRIRSEQEYWQAITPHQVEVRKLLMENQILNAYINRVHTSLCIIPHELDRAYEFGNLINKEIDEKESESTPEDDLGNLPPLSYFDDTVNDPEDKKE